MFFELTCQNILGMYIIFIYISSNIYTLYLFCFSMCWSAIPLTAIEPTCTPLRFGAYCKKHGINLESYVFENHEDQQIASWKLDDTQKGLEKLKPIYDAFNKSKKCLQAGIKVPPYDRTGRTTKEHKPCKGTCDYFMKTCMKIVEVRGQIIDHYINCSTFPTGEEGSLLECWYYDG